MRIEALNDALLHQAVVLRDHAESCASALLICESFKLYHLDPGIKLEVLLQADHSTMRAKAYVAISQPNPDIIKIVTAVFKDKFNVTYTIETDSFQAKLCCLKGQI